MALAQLGPLCCPRGGWKPIQDRGQVLCLPTIALLDARDESACFKQWVLTLPERLNKLHKLDFELSRFSNPKVAMPETTVTGTFLPGRQPLSQLRGQCQASVVAAKLRGMEKA